MFLFSNIKCVYIYIYIYTHLIRDICLLVPCITALLCGQADLAFEALKKVIVDDEPELDPTMLGGHPRLPFLGLLGDVHVAGPPCTDF